VGSLKRRLRRRAWIALGLSALIHLIVAAALLRSPAPLSSAQSKSIEVQLVAPAEDRRLSDEPAGRTPKRSRREHAQSDTSSPLVPDEAHEDSPSFTPPPSGQTQAPDVANLRRALRGAIGCGSADLMNLSPPERQKCRDQSARRLAARPDRAFGADPRKTARFAEEANEREPFLARTPKDNCVPRLTDKEVGMGSGATHDTTFGIACAKSF
jgi:hypothetical protein